MSARPTPILNSSTCIANMTVWVDYVRWVDEEGVPSAVRTQYDKLRDFVTSHRTTTGSILTKPERDQMVTWRMEIDDSLTKDQKKRIRLKAKEQYAYESREQEKMKTLPRMRERNNGSNPHIQELERSFQAFHGLAPQTSLGSNALDGQERRRIDKATEESALQSHGRYGDIRSTTILVAIYEEWIQSAKDANGNPAMDWTSFRAVAKEIEQELVKHVVPLETRDILAEYAPPGG